jgi:3-dehydroquinate synthase
MTDLAPLTIRSAQGPYAVSFHGSAADAMTAAADAAGSLVLIDRRVRQLYVAACSASLGRAPLMEMDATEDLKTWSGCAQVLEWLSARGASRRSTLVAIGGGVVQDVATLAAHVFHRGMHLVLVPTTLLAMCDSCIGAKSGINLGTLKNQLGVFHAPAAVHLAPEFATTLSDADLASGHGEILKLSLTRDPPWVDELAVAWTGSGLRGPHLASLVRQSLSTKQAIIEVDEHDRGPRRLLNFGHTFGHALEGLADYGVPHGLAVAWGIDLVNYIALREGRLAESDFGAVHQLIARHLAARHVSKPTAAALVAAAGRDKKAAGGVIDLVLMSRPGALAVVPHPLDHDLEGLVDDYLRERDVFSA